MVRYQFVADDEEWEAWKETLPRDKSIEARINELIRADTVGKVDPDVDVAALHDALDDLTYAAEKGDAGRVKDALGRARQAVPPSTAP